MQQGPGDLWLLGAPPADSATPQLTLDADGTPDSSAHPGSIHLGGLAEGVTFTPGGKLEFMRIDQCAGPVDAVITEESLKLEAVMAEAQDVAKVRHLLSQGVYGSDEDGQEITLGGAQSLFAFAGTGINDLTRGGTYTALATAIYDVKISTAAATDKFQWRKDAGSWSAEISITGAAQSLSDGVTILFLATTGHTATDAWAITALPLTPCIVAISATKDDATQFIVCVLFRARSMPAPSLVMSRGKAMQAKLEFEALLDPARAAGRQSGVWYVTE